MAKKQENVTIKHIKAGHFRVAAADSAHLSVATDSLGTTFHLTFTRLDKSPTAETFPAEILEGGGIVQVGPPTFDDPQCRIQEFGVLLRPDHAFNVAQLLIRQLVQLDEGQKKRYGIPDLPADRSELDRGAAE